MITFTVPGQPVGKGRPRIGRVGVHARMFTPEKTVNYEGLVKHAAHLAIARDYGMHIHIVHHIRKLENEAKRPDKNDIKGTGAIADQVDNILTVWRNKTEPAARKQGDPDAVLSCCKQRHGEWEGAIALWFDHASQQFTESALSSPINFAERAV